MTKFIFLIFFIPCMAISASKTPPAIHGEESGIDIRLMKKWQDFIFLAETKNRAELSDQNYHQVLMGSYFRFSKKFRLGGFFQAEQGLRWDVDWIKAGTWKWQSLSNRWDFSTVLDLTYSDVLHSKFSWEWKNRFFYYHSRDALLLKTRPGLRYFFLKNNLPWWQIYTEFEAYVPLNYGVNAVYETWTYLGGLYQINEQFSLGPMLAYRERWFHAYDEFSAKAKEDFRTKWTSLFYGLNFVYLLP